MHSMHVNDILAFRTREKSEFAQIACSFRGA
jgi:hypothetical protein